MTKMIYNGKKYMWSRDISVDDDCDLDTGKWLLFEDGHYSHVNAELSQRLDAELEKRLKEFPPVDVNGLEVLPAQYTAILDEANGRTRRNPEMEDDREPFEDTPELGWETPYGRG